MNSKVSSRINYKVTIAFLLFSTFLISSGLKAQVSYSLEVGYESWPAEKREAIIKAMDEAVEHYNKYGYFNKTLTVNYNPDVPTANANYAGRIQFGGSISTRTALHEISHTMGVGTTQAWRDGIVNDIWTLPKANARIVLYNGEGTQIKGDKWHFWSSIGPSYGLNFAKGDGSTNRIRHVKMVSAFRWDMGIVKDSDKDGMPDDWEIFYFKTLSNNGSADIDKDGASNLEEYNADTNPTSKFEWVKVDDRNEAVTYDGNWGKWPSDPSYNTTVNFSEVTGATVEYSFTGTKVRFYGFKRNDLGFADIYLNDKLQASVDCYADELHPDELLYESDSLDYGDYTLKIVVKGTKNANSSGTEIIVDAFEYFEGESVTSVLTNKWDDSMRSEIYPNPTAGAFTIKLKDNELTTAKIFDLQGQLLYQNSFISEITINKSEVSARGLVLVQITNDKLNHLKKLIIE